MERIDTRKKAVGKAELLALALSVAAVIAVFFYASPERPTAEASPPPAAEVVPENKGLWLTVPKMARVDDLPVVTAPSSTPAR